METYQIYDDESGKTMDIKADSLEQALELSEGLSFILINKEG